jgi:hypothetical protein
MIVSEVDQFKVKFHIITYYFKLLVNGLKNLNILIYFLLFKVRFLKYRYLKLKLKYIEQNLFIKSIFIRLYLLV